MLMQAGIEKKGRTAMAKELFERIDRKVGNLLDDVASGKVGLPDLQRPFVWNNSKVCDLFDSMIKGFPIGYIMLWKSPDAYDKTKDEWVKDGQFKHPDDLVIDGQQRLTSLIAVMTGRQMKDKNFKERKIRLSFNPLEVQFLVWSAATEKDTQLISDISEVYKANKAHELSKFRKNLIKRMNEGRTRKGEPQLSDEEENRIEENIKQLLDLEDFTIPTLRILSKAEEEDVAEIFRRVNSGGQTLNENNFVETLLAVFDNDLHKIILDFCEKSRIPKDGTAYNNIIEVNSSHLIRIALGIGFHRARMRYGYKLLRGKDLETGTTSEKTRTENMGKFREAVLKATSLNDWHSFLNLFSEAGYITGDLLASKQVVVFSYILYLMGKYEYKAPRQELNKCIIRWIFMASITQFYTDGTTESIVESLFADFKRITDAKRFMEYLDKTIKERMTDDYFSVTLPNNMKTSSTTSPLWYGYIASLNILGTPMLFSNTPLASCWHGSSGTKKSNDKHHIFPKNYLSSIGITDDRDRNQIANLTIIDYGTNINISDKAPKDYVPEYKWGMSDEDFRKACAENALPEGFENMDYFDFLEQRRKLMASVVRRAFNKLWT